MTFRVPSTATTLRASLLCGLLFAMLDLHGGRVVDACLDMLVQIALVVTVVGAHVLRDRSRTRTETP